MKLARIIATPEADPLRLTLERGLASAGWEIVHSQVPGEPELVLALGISQQDFAAVCASAAAGPPAGRARLAVHIATRQVPPRQVPTERPGALPAAALVCESEVRRLALNFAPRLRVNATIAQVAGAQVAGAQVTGAQVTGAPDRLAGEILAAVMLFVECPAMTGVVIGIDRPTGEQASRQQQGESGS